MNNWEKLGIEKKEDVIKYMLAKIQERRAQILDKGLGGAWKTGKYKHGEIPELREAVFIIGHRTMFLTDKGFLAESEIR